ncbi:MAG: hypothetical protein ABWZ98_05400, partial [Nakamurella sp.]
ARHHLNTYDYFGRRIPSTTIDKLAQACHSHLQRRTAATLLAPEDLMADMAPDLGRHAASVSCLPASYRIRLTSAETQRLRNAIALAQRPLSTQQELS